MTDQPNIVFILADDMGYGDFSAFNNGRSQTPAIDGLMKDGLSLTQQYTASPVCNPSRAALMTGRYPHRTGSIDTLEWRGLERLALREQTIAQLLSAAGYCTGHIGKWHLGAFDVRYSPTQRGFDEAVCFRGGMHDYYDWRIEYNDQPQHTDGRYLTDVWTEEAVSFIERHQKNTPFFLSLNYNAPHTPLQVPDEDAQPFRETGEFTEGVCRIYGMIRRMDAGIGRILETIDKCGLRENTVIIFTSDNGPQFSKKGDDPATDIFRFNCNFNGAKGMVYEGGVRVPLVIRWPAGLTGNGRRFDGMAHFTDWFVTMLAMAGVTPPGDRTIDGINLLPTLQGESDETCDKRFWQWNRYTPVPECNAAIRDGDWKLVFPRIQEAFVMPENHLLQISMYNYEHFVENGLIIEPEPEREVPSPHAPELYNIADDPLEKNNLAGVEPDRVRTMRLDMENWFEDVERERHTIID